MGWSLSKTLGTMVWCDETIDVGRAPDDREMLHLPGSARSERCHLNDGHGAPMTPEGSNPGVRTGGGRAIRRWSWFALAFALLGLIHSVKT
jgi:hypothetical protein